jgi:hypothetical protein
MLFGKYKFRCCFESKARLPTYKGSTFRGVFGHALKSIVCALKHRTCDQCLLKTQCIYALVFETHHAIPPPAGLRIVAPPHPFVIEPPPTEKTDFSAGDSFDFNLILFGQINRNLPYFIYAFDRMGDIGIGKKINGRRGRFDLKAVEQDGHILYSGEDQRLDVNDDFSRLTLKQPEKVPNPHGSRLKITLKTPLRLKFQNRFSAELPFHLLVRAMLRRTDTLLRCYGDQTPDMDFKGLVRRAQAVRIVESESDLHWFDWQRYSQRQDQKMLMGGILGSVTYEGAIEEFLPLVKFCEKTHIGKQTAFGLGHLAVEGV